MNDNRLKYECLLYFKAKHIIATTTIVSVFSSELIQGDNEHRALKREIRQLQEDRERTLEDEPEPETSLDAFPKQLPS